MKTLRICHISCDSWYTYPEVPLRYHGSPIDAEETLLPKASRLSISRLATESNWSGFAFNFNTTLHQHIIVIAACFFAGVLKNEAN